MLHNCPFHHLSRTHTELVCSLNLDLVIGLLEAMGQAVSRARLSPLAGRCCVVIVGGGREENGIIISSSNIELTSENDDDSARFRVRGLLRQRLR